jgi:predicted dehydrogenase
MASDSPQPHPLPDTAAVTVQRPQYPRPVVIIGAGGIVRTAHLPAYAKAGFTVVGIADEIPERAESLAKDHGIQRAFGSVEAAVRFAPPDVVFDVAIPASQLVHVLPRLPDRSAVLMQKPMGETLTEATQIRGICRDKELTAAVNFSLRYSPNHLAVRALADSGALGTIHDIEVQVRAFTPWHLWTFLATAPRLEILYHSIHYFDLIRSWLGNPHSVAAKTVKSPHNPGLAATKTIAILDYGDSVRVFVATNHSHEFGPPHQHSFVQWEGTAGAARMTMGVYLDYPRGRPDTVEYALRGSNTDAWTRLPISGEYFPDGFMGPMAALQCLLEGSAATLPSHYDDAYQTMQLVEALYRSSAGGGAMVLMEDAH